MEYKKEIQPRSRDILQGALTGARFWLVYALVECWFVSLLTWAVKPSYYFPVHWAFTAFLFLIYPLTGLILGGILGRLCVSKPRSPLFISSGSIFLLTAAFMLNFIVQYPNFNNFGLSEIPGLALAVFMLLISGVSAISVTVSKRFRFLINPWVVSFLLPGVPWLIAVPLANYSMPFKAGAVTVYVVIVFTAAFLFDKLRTLRTASPLNAFDLRSQVRHLLILASIAILTLLLGSRVSPLYRDNIDVASASGSKDTYPNIILIVMDTVRADHVSVYGYPGQTTPFLKDMVQSSTLYTHAVSSGDMTLSSHASIFTGLYVKQHGAFCDPWQGFGAGKPLSEKFDTIAELLEQKGYLTLGVVANNVYLTGDFKLDQGFEFYDHRAPTVLLGQSDYFYMRQGIRNMVKYFFSPDKYDQLFRRAEEINSVAFDLLGRIRGKSNPFFLFINYMDAHDPYVPPAPYDRLFPGKEKGFNLSEYYSIARQVNEQQSPLPEAERNHMISQYDGGIAYIDAQLGVLITRLKEQGLFEDSLIIITSDHGEAFGERNFMGHGVSVYQDQTGVPLIVKYPGQKRGRSVEKVVSSIDILPTILDVLGAEIPRYLPGETLLQLSPGRINNPVVSESYPDGDLIDMGPRFDRVEKAIYSGPYKYINSTKGKQELYNMVDDPAEQTNLYSPDDRNSVQIAEKLENWDREMMEMSLEQDRLNKDTLDRLKSLGYIN